MRACMNDMCNIRHGLKLNIKHTTTRLINDDISIFMNYHQLNCTFFIVVVIEIDSSEFNSFSIRFSNLWGIFFNVPLKVFFV